MPSASPIRAERYASDRRPFAAIGDAGPALMTLAGALAFSGLAELFLQRIVYRVGVHIPRSGAFLEAYRFATFSGDFAFRATAVLLAVTSVVAVIWLAQRRDYGVAGLIATLIGANLLAWPLGIAAGARLTPIIFAFAAAWLVGGTLARRRQPLLVLATVSAGFALALSQYQAGMTALGDQPGSIATIQLLGELGLLVTAALITAAAVRRPVSAPAAALAALMTLALVASYTREPSTVAIVALWATGVTMSLPGILYVLAFAGVAFAGLSWLRRPDTSHLAIALALLFVAGLQPQALHHGLTAFLGLVLLSSPSGTSTPAEAPSEVEYAA